MEAKKTDVFSLLNYKKTVNFAFGYFYFMLVYMPVLASGFQMNSKFRQQKP